MITLSTHQVEAIARLVLEHKNTVDLSFLAVTHRSLDVTLWDANDRIIATYNVSVGGTARSHDHLYAA